MALDISEPLCISPNHFDMDKHFYPKVLNAQLNPLIRHFIHMNNQRIVSRYCHLNPHTNAEALLRILEQPCRHLPWAGCDLMHVTNAFGHRQMVVIETNSSPSGQKSMPIDNEEEESNGYGKVVRSLVLPHFRHKKNGILAVLFDKNFMEASGYAAAMADELDEEVWLIPCEDGGPSFLMNDGQQLFLNYQGSVQPIRFAYRYVTQRPWNRLPIGSKTAMVNPIIGCLAGGRNKALAAKAYDLYNAKIKNFGLKINTPQTIWDVHFEEIPLWVERLGGFAAIKVPYSNAGQGVYTITSADEFAIFQNEDSRHYERYIVQSLIGHYQWSSGINDSERLFHVGTIPNKHGQIFVSDLRMMVSYTEKGWRPVAMYARRTRKPIQPTVNNDSWEMLGTNLSYKDESGQWSTESNRLLLMDERDFNRLGLSMDELIEAYVQTVMAVQSINEMGENLLNSKRKLRRRLFSSMVNDQSLSEEVMG